MGHRIFLAAILLFGQLFSAFLAKNNHMAKIKEYGCDSLERNLFIFPPSFF